MPLGYDRNGGFVMKYTLKEKLRYVKKHLEENVPLGRREDIRHSRGTYQRNSRFNQINRPYLKREAIRARLVAKKNITGNIGR